MAEITAQQKAEFEQRLEQVIKDETELVFPHFDHQVAWDIGHLIIEEAGKRGFNLALRITEGDLIVFQYAMPGTKAGNNVWLDRKAQTVADFGESTERVALYSALMGKDFYDLPWTDPFTQTKHGGGFPIRVKSASGVLGAFALSGAHGAEHGFIVEMVRKYLDSVG